MTPSRVCRLLLGLGASALVAGCGGAPHDSAPAASTPVQPATTTTGTPSTSTQPRPAQTSTVPSPNALQAEPTSAAAGDIPDNQVYITFRDAAAGYSIKYPEGWAQQGTSTKVTLRDKNNIVRIVVATSPLPSAARVRAELRRLRGAQLRSRPRPVTIGGGRAFKVVYSTESARNPVTGKRVTLVVDRYYLSSAGKEAVVDLGTPQGVDNVDAYRLMIESFRWR